MIITRYHERRVEKEVCDLVTQIQERGVHEGTWSEVNGLWAERIERARAKHDLIEVRVRISAWETLIGHVLDLMLQHEEEHQEAWREDLVMVGLRAED